MQLCKIETALTTLILAYIGLRNGETCRDVGLKEAPLQTQFAKDAQKSGSTIPSRLLIHNGTLTDSREYPKTGYGTSV
jgi:hypothetical protein